ncbi:MAG: hypothetical protein E7580_04250 [Ruminococcaceae bacterium]|nr:hypothetical protein [Oscillospiraceae bacterium]
MILLTMLPSDGVKEGKGLSGKRMLSIVLIWAVLCPVLASCATPLAQHVSADEKAEEERETGTATEAMTAYPCEIDPDFCRDWEYETLTAAALDALPFANGDMTAMERRKLCLDYFQLQLSFLWQTNLDVTDYDPTYYDFKDDSRALRTENLYAGVPYQAGGNGNLYRVMEYYDEETGLLDLRRAFSEYGGYGAGGEIDSVKKDADGNVIYKRYRALKTFFNVCSSGANWGWSRVINSADFGSTTDTNVNGGFIPIGCYTYPGMENIDRFGQVTDHNPTGLDTTDVVRQVGEDRLYHYYALMRPADCVVSPGHIMMVKKVNLVRRGDGTPDPLKSSVVTLEQIENWGERGQLEGRSLYRQGGVDRVYTFEELKESAYLPFTFAELLDENDPFDKPHLDFYNRYVLNRNHLGEKYKLMGFDEKTLDRITGADVEKAELYLSGEPASLGELAKCNLASNYPISDVFVRVRDADGGLMLENVYRTKGSSTRVVAMSSYMSNAATDESGKSPSMMTGVDEAVARGGRLEIAVQISTGELLFVENINF